MFDEIIPHVSASR